MQICDRRVAKNPGVEVSGAFLPAILFGGRLPLSGFRDVRGLWSFLSLDHLELYLVTFG
jgi:hypothetical protein